MKPTTDLNRKWMKYKNNVIYLSAGNEEWVPISNIIERIDKLEKLVTTLELK